VRDFSSLVDGERAEEINFSLFYDASRSLLDFLHSNVIYRTKTEERALSLACFIILLFSPGKEILFAQEECDAGRRW
jgi:hypothetical protein